MDARKPTFDEYWVAAREQIASASSELDKSLRVDRVEQLALKLAYLTDVEGLPRTSDELDVFVRTMLAKLTNELLATCGCIRAGTAYGALHHARAIVETRAAIHYVLNEPVERDARLSRFIEFGRLLPWQTRYAEVQDGRQHMSVVSESLIAHATPVQVAKWIALYGCKNEKALAKLPRWHSGSITQLIEALDQGEIIARSYARMCHPTHASPIGHRLGSWGPLRALGHDPQAAASAINTAFSHSYFALRDLDQAMNGAIKPWVAAELAALVQPAG